MTTFGKLLRKIRIDFDELLYDMAQKLGVSSAFLSAVENGKKTVPTDWVRKIVQFYALDEQMQMALQRAADETVRQVRIDVNGATPAHRNLAIAFAREFPTLSESAIDEFTKFFDSLQEDEHE